jgi:hypothetical protein
VNPLLATTIGELRRALPAGATFEEKGRWLDEEFRRAGEDFLTAANALDESEVAPPPDALSALESKACRIEAVVELRRQLSTAH